MDQTCYYFDVQPSALSPALDRFAQFFISPLFDPSCTEREANAVHSENSKNLQVDMWRFFQLDKSLSSREHSFWRFGTGTKETLYDEPLARGEDVRKRLIEWCEAHYSANVCKLAVVGKGAFLFSFSLRSSSTLTTPTPRRFPQRPHQGRSRALLRRSQPSSHSRRVPRFSLHLEGAQGAFFLRLPSFLF